MPFAEVSQFGEFCVSEDAAHGVVRAAEDEHARVRLDGSFHALDVERPAVICVEGERHIDAFASGVVGGGEKGG